MPPDNIVIEEVQSILREDKTVSPKVRDRLILALLLSMNTTLSVVAGVQTTDHADIGELKEYRDSQRRIASRVAWAVILAALSGAVGLAFTYWRPAL